MCTYLQNFNFLAMTLTSFRQDVEGRGVIVPPPPPKVKIKHLNSSKQAEKLLGFTILHCIPVSMWPICHTMLHVLISFRNWSSEMVYKVACI